MTSQSIIIVVLIVHPYPVEGSFLFPAFGFRMAAVLTFLVFWCAMLMFVLIWSNKGVKFSSMQGIASPAVVARLL